MIALALEDTHVAPNAFDWNGPLDHAWLIGWLAQRRLNAPADLVALWSFTGGGDMFETEEVLCPSAKDLEHDLEYRGGQLVAGGLSEELLVFHAGLYLTAVGRDGKIVKLDPDTLRPSGSFSSLDDWYADLRAEYADRYGLPAVA